MTIKVEAFLALEASLALRLSKSLTKATASVYADVERLLKAGEFQQAAETVQGLSLNSVFEDNKAYIEYVSNLAMLFGASRVTRTPGTSVVGLGYEKMMVQQSILTFQYSVVTKATEYLKTTALQLIAQRKLASQAGQEVSIHKADPDAPVVQPFASFMDKSGRAFFDTTSSLHTSRLSAYGFTAEADVMGYTTYQINEQLDSRTCDVCRMMHGKTFQVKDARSLLDVVLRTQNPDELKSLQPWPSQSAAGLQELEAMTPREIVAKGWHVPPFHPRCRGLLARSGRVPKLRTSPSNPQPPQEPYKPSYEEFKALGINLKEDALKTWADVVGLPPAEVVTKITGQSLPEFLAALPTDLSMTKLKEAIGLKSLTVKDDVAIRMATKMFGSNEAVEQSLKILAGKAELHLGVLDITAVDQGAGIAKQYMKNLIALASDMEVSKVTLTAGLDVGGYAWAKYGFLPTADDWGALKTAIEKKVATLDILSGKSELQIKAYQAIMASSDPSSLFALADLPGLGKEILLGTSWPGVLSLTSPEQMTRFMAYIGAAK